MQYWGPVVGTGKAIQFHRAVVATPPLIEAVKPPSHQVGRYDVSLRGIRRPPIASRATRTQLGPGRNDIW